MTRRLLFLLFALTVALPFAASADETFSAYSAERLESAQAAGKPVLVDVWATWCPTCKQQHAVLSKLLAEPEFAGIVAIRVDWDAQREVARGFGAPRQSTLLLYRGRERIAMSVAETDPDRLRKLLRQLIG